MTRRTLLATAAAAAAILAAALALPLTGRADPPDDFQPWLERLKTFDTVFVELGGWDGHHVLRADATGLVTLDAVYPGQRRVRLAPGQATTLHGHWPGMTGEVVHDPLLHTIVSDLWAELRSGLENCTWTDTDPILDGYFPAHTDPNFPGMPENEAWARVDLPFAWASRWSFYVGMRKGAGAPMRFYVLDLDHAVPGRRESILGRITMLWFFDVPLGPDRDSALAPPVHYEGNPNLLVWTRGDPWHSQNPYHVVVQRSVVDPGPGHRHTEPELGPGHDHGFGFPPGHTHAPLPPAPRNRAKAGIPSRPPSAGPP